MKDKDRDSENDPNRMLQHILEDQLKDFEKRISRKRPNKKRHKK